MMAATTNIKFNNGREIPVLGLGTWRLDKETVGDTVKHALDIGYRHIDCAALYQNEEEIGQAIKEKIDSGHVKREDLFVTSKSWGTTRSRDRVVEGFKKSLKDLKLEYMDLYLIHFPVSHLQTDKTITPCYEDGKFISCDIDFLETWKGMEDLVKSGLVRSIGVSNFSLDQLKRVIDNCEIRPVNNQVELHPYLVQSELVEGCQKLGVTVTAYCPLSSPDRCSLMAPGLPNIFEDPTLQKIAKKHGKTVAQIAIRYEIDRNAIAVPKSANKSHLKENLAVFDFKLSPGELKQIDGLNKNSRVLPFTFLDESHKYYPF